jgi:hypothetical protein
MRADTGGNLFGRNLTDSGSNLSGSDGSREESCMWRKSPRGVTERTLQAVSGENLSGGWREEFYKRTAAEISPGGDGWNLAS